MHPWKKKIVDRRPIDKMVEFSELLSQPDGMKAGAPIVLADFQKEICEIFGRDKNGHRVVNTLLVSIPRKNAKTAFTSMIILFMLAAETIPYAQHYSIAADREQAAILFNYARNMVLMNPDLAEIISITESKKLLTNVENGSTFTALSSEGKTKHGRSSRLVCVDELHAIPPSSDLFSVMETSMGAYGEEALMVIIGTQSPDDTNPMSEWVDYAEKVNSGEVEDDSFAGFVWTAPEDCDPFDEKVWYACNPAMVAGFRTYSEMKKVANRAKELGGAKLAEFRNLYLNQRIDSKNPFISKDAWIACDKKPDMDAFNQYPTYGGLDLSKRGDLTSLVLVCQDDDNIIHAKVYAWTPKELLKAHEASDKVPYRKWVEEEYLEAVPGKSIGYDWLAVRLGEILDENFQLVSINFDRWRITELEYELDKEGVTLPLKEFGQGYKSFAGALDDLEHAIATQELAHGSHPVLTWNISNAVVDQDPAGNRKINKDKSFSRVDCAVALAMAVRGLRLDQEAQGITGTEEAIMFV